MRTPAGNEVTVTGPFPACPAERTVTNGGPVVACGPVTFSTAGTATRVGEQNRVRQKLRPSNSQLLQVSRIQLLFSDYDADLPGSLQTVGQGT